MGSNNHILWKNNNITWGDENGCEHLRSTKNGLTIEMTFKPEPEEGLHPELSQLLGAYIGELLQEIEHEEKLIIEAEKKAAKQKSKRQDRRKITKR